MKKLLISLILLFFPISSYPLKTKITKSQKLHKNNPEKMDIELYKICCKPKISPEDLVKASNLLGNGANPNFTFGQDTSFIRAASLMHRGVVRVILDGYKVDIDDKNKALLSVCKKNSVSPLVIRLLLRHGADPNVFEIHNGYHKNSALYFLCIEGYNLRGIRKLVKNIKMKLETKNDALFKLFNLSWDLSRESETIEITKILLKHNADPNYKETIDTTFLKACIYSTAKVVKEFLSSKRVNSKNINKALRAVIFNKNRQNQDIEIIKELLDGGADINFKGNVGDTTLDLIKERGSDEVKKFFKIKIKNNDTDNNDDTDNNNNQSQNKSYMLLVIPIVGVLALSSLFYFRKKDKKSSSQKLKVS